MIIKGCSLRTRHDNQVKTQSTAFIIAVIISCLLSGYLGFRYFDDTPIQSGIKLDSRINPNTASGASLVRLPNIGPKRAEAIIDYRESFTGKDRAFQRAADMEKIKGIGPKTVENLQALVVFE